MSDQLHDAFRELREHERTEAPSFDALLASAPRVPRSRARFAMIAAAMAAALAAVLLWPRHMKDDVAPLSISDWRAPTDVLLKTPGGDWLSELPALDESILNLQGSP